MNENIWPWALWLIGLSLLFSGWMRSWFVSGIDINLEYSLFTLTQGNSIWALQGMDNNYDAMLSLTILPTILSWFIKTNNQLIIKFFLPLIFSLITLIVYLIARKYFKKIICFFSTLFFISQYSFITWMAIPLRQEIAFIFFGLMLLIFFAKEINLLFKKILFLLFGGSMIVSHYSTAYIALAIFTSTYIIVFFYKQYENKKIKEGKLELRQKSEFYLTGALILLLFLFGFLWYSQVTPTADSLIDFASKSISNLGDMFNKEVQAEGQSLLAQFQISNPINYFKEFQDYNKEILDYYNQTNSYNPIKYYPSNVIFSKGIPYKLNLNLVNIFFSFWGLLKIFLGEFLIFFGTLFLLFNMKKNKKFKEYITLILITLSVFCFIAILPFITLGYDLIRVYEQILILLSISEILGILFLFKYIKKGKYILVGILLIIYFLFSSTFFIQLIGGNNISMRINNLGNEYDMLYSHEEEYFSGLWITSNNNPTNLIQADNRAKDKLILSNLKLKTLNDIVPYTINSKNYIYASYTNTNERLAFKFFRGNIIPFNFPNNFLNNNKNKIYNNGGAGIFK